MGAGISYPKCPTPFVSTDAISCVMPCPADRKFNRVGTNGAYKCVYSPDPQISVDLVTVGAVSFDGTTLDELRPVNVQKHTEFITEKDRFDKAIAVVYANIDRQKKITDAFNDLQAAENARDQSPEAYQTARTAYYTLIKGPEWINEEKQRIANAEVNPEIQKYRDSVNSVNVRNQEQQKTIDVVNGIKDRVLSLRDDFKYSVDTFGEQLEKVKIQINMENRSREKEKDTTWAWVDVGLNVLLVAVLIYGAYTLGRKYFFPPRPVVTRPAIYLNSPGVSIRT